MDKPYVFVTADIGDPFIRELEAHFEVGVWREERELPHERLVEEARRAHGLLVMLRDRIDREVLSGPHLKVVSTLSVGYNHIDLEAARERGIWVAHTPGVLTEATADLVFALLMACGRRLVEANRFLHRGQWKSWSPYLLVGQDIHGATLGIVGMGRIGEAVARRAQGFSMKILYHNRRRKPEAEERYGAEYRTLDDLLRESDYVVLLTPLTEETRNLIGARELRLMKKTAYLINAARGEIVDEEALVEALREGWIAGAGLDVFRQEPVPPDHPLLAFDNVVALPHIGSASLKTRKAMAKMAVEAVIDGVLGRKPKHVVPLE